MGCLDSFAIQTNNYNPNNNYNNNNYHYSYSYNNNPIYINNNVDTDDFNEWDFPHFQPNFYDTKIKNIKKVYEERINEGNNIRVKIHKIFILINYVVRNTTTIQIEIEKINGRPINKHLTQLFNNECSFDNVKPLIELYNSDFKIDSRQWYQSKSSSDIYIKAEKINNKLFKILEMFYEKDISEIRFNKIIKLGNSENSGEAIYTNISPGKVVRVYNLSKREFYDNSHEIFDYVEEERFLPLPEYKPKKNNYSNKTNYSNNNNYSNKKNYSNNNNYSYNDSYSNHDNNSNHERNSSNHNNNDNNNESEEKKSRHSAIMRNEHGQEVGRVDRNGIIRDSRCQEVGRFDDDGRIRDSRCQEVGRIDDDGRIRDSCCQEIGRVESDGRVRDENGNEIGRIDDDGKVRDENGNEIGSAEGMTKEQAAYLNFFRK